MTAIVTRGDAANLHLPDESVDLLVTSPPYFGLRSYQDGGVHYSGQVGDEATPGEYLDALIACTREWQRVLKPGGSIFINLGDRFSPGIPLSRDGMTMEDAAWLAGVIDSDGSISIRINKQPEGRAPSFVPWVRVGQMKPEVVQQIAEKRNKGTWSRVTPEDIAYRQSIRDAVLDWNGNRPNEYLPPRIARPQLPATRTFIEAKSLMGLPWRYAIRCIDELGLILRAEIVWAKPNGLPESVTDRVRRSHEQVFHMVKQPRYYSAVDEVREASDTGGRVMYQSVRPQSKGMPPRGPSDLDSRVQTNNPLGKLPGSVWSIPTAPLIVPDRLGVDHFAAFPPELVRRIVLGWSPREVCTVCGEGRRPVSVTDAGRGAGRMTAYGAGNHGTGASTLGGRGGPTAVITGYVCACPDTTAPTTPGVVLDPFMGTGTTVMVASVLGRVGIGVDLSADYVRLARWRVNDPGERARSIGLPKPVEQVSGQLGMFDGLGA